MKGGFRGASAINWTIICGDAEAGLTLFWADEGVDTGPILLQRKCVVEENDTLTSLYKRFLYPEGVTATVNILILTDCFLKHGGQLQCKEDNKKFLRDVKHFSKKHVNLICKSKDIFKETTFIKKQIC